MAMNESSNFLLGASHYNHPQTHYYHQNSVGEGALHGIDTIPSIDRRASSVQSLHTLYASTRSPTSISYPRLQHFANQSVKTAHEPSPPPTSSTILLPPANNNASIYASLCHLDTRYPRRVSVSTIRAPEDAVPYFRQKSFDETSISYHPSKETTEISLKKATHERKNTEPIEIRVRCIFSRVGEIDTLNERYTAEIFFEASWYDRDQQVELKYDPQLGHFNPQLVVLNHIGDTLRHEKWHSVTKSHEHDLTEITEHHKIRGVFWERMELNHFPYDVQELSLSLTTPLTTADIYFIQNKQKPSGVNRTVFSDQQSWYLYEHVEFEYEKHREEYSLNFNQVHPVVVCTCHVGRKCGYYIWNAYFLIFLITSASLCTFAIPPSNTHGRLQITCTLLLTSVTFRWVVNKSLPTISYLTALDVYAISSIVVLCIINVFHGVISYIYYNQIYLASSQASITTNALHLSLYPDYALCRLDRYAFFIFLSSFCLYQILILLWTFWVPYKRRCAMSDKDEKNRKQLTNKNKP